MNGKKKDADNIVDQTMERRMAKAIKPFFENIGVDVAAVQLASSLATRGGDGADAGLIPVGEALGADTKRPRVLAMPDKSPRRRPGAADRRMPDRQSSKRSKKNEVVLLSETELPAPSGERARRATTLASAKPETKPSSATPRPAATERLPATVKPEPVKVEPASESPSAGFATTLGVSRPPVLVSQTVERKVEIAGREPVPQPVSQSAPKTVVASPTASDNSAGGPVNLINFDLAQSRSASVDTAAAAPATRALGDIIKGIDIPDRETKSAVVPVDLDEIEPAKPQPKIVAKPAEKTPVKPKEPVHPKRYWVQIATGSNLNALKFDYRRMTKKQPELFKQQKAWTSPWGSTRRMVVGPFDDFKAAKEFEAELRKDGGDGFAWASADGVEVNELTK